MSTEDGRADAATDTTGSPDQGTNKFGCSSSSCDDVDYGIKVLQHDGTSWVSNWSAVSITPDNPPYRHTWNSYWSFQTCNSSC